MLIQNLKILIHNKQFQPFIIIERASKGRAEGGGRRREERGRRGESGGQGRGERRTGEELGEIDR